MRRHPNTPFGLFLAHLRVDEQETSSVMAARLDMGRSNLANTEVGRLPLNMIILEKVVTQYELSDVQFQALSDSISATDNTIKVPTDVIGLKLIREIGKLKEKLPFETRSDILYLINP